MALVTLQHISVTHGGPYLMEDVSLSIDPGDRLCLVGRNGAGKSTLLRILAGTEQPDGGVVGVPSDLRRVLLPQEGDGMSRPDDVPARRFLSLLGVADKDPGEAMSGGEKRRTMLAGVLAADGDVLLLDEPTNHLDIETIRWLEEYLTGPECRRRAIVFVTHDRAFARRIGNRTAELDRGTLRVYNEGYDAITRRRDDRLEEEDRREREFRKKLGAEEAWLARGTKARRTRDEGRVKALMEMRKRYEERRARLGSAQIHIAEGGRSGDLVAETEGLVIRWPGAETPLVSGLTTTIFRGDRIGIVGPNGAGKTTLARVLLEEMEPGRSGSTGADSSMTAPSIPETEGFLRRGANLEVLYFDQFRKQLDGDITLFEAAGGGYDTITVGTTRRNVTAYLRDFLFTEGDENRPVRTLSGGERNRLLLARLFAKPSNVLVLDEPTNDLDTDTLDLLEQRLARYKGTIILITHDREFLDNIVAGCVVLPGDGTVEEYAGGYSDWEARYHARRVAVLQGQSPSRPSGDDVGSSRRPTLRTRKLTFRERQELEAIPDRIESLEAEKGKIHNDLSDPETYRQAAEDNTDLPAELTRRLEAIEEELETVLLRWEELEELAAAE